MILDKGILLTSILVIILTAVLAGMRTVYGFDWCTNREKPFYQVWTSRRLYPAVFIWLVVYFLLWYLSDQSMTAIRLLDLVLTYLILAAVDVKRKVVPDPIFLCYFAGQMLMGALAVEPTELWHMVWTGTVFGAIVLISALISKEKVGMGDVLLLWITAMTAGWMYTLLILALGLFLSFAFGIVLIIFRRGTLNTEVPFVPFLTMGTILHTLFFVLEI